jgi:hypothetical protein
VPSGGDGIVWRGNLKPGIAKYDATVRRAMSLACRVNAGRAETWMKNNAAWADQTGNARNGLRAVHEPVGRDGDRIVLYGSVPYQIWLEIRFSGRYAIIGPAVREWAPRVMRSVRTYVFSRGA